jgi:imidazolonepropionase-like amidohydrolase
MQVMDFKAGALRMLGTACALACCACASVKPTAQMPPAADTAIVGARILAAPDAPGIEHGVVLLRDGRIEAVGATGAVHVPEHARVIDARGLTLAAGFWNSHVHLIDPVLLHAGTGPVPEVKAGLQQLLTRWGFSTAFELGGAPGNTLALRRRIANGELDGPLLLTVDAPFYPKGGTPVYVRDLYADGTVPSAEVADPIEAAGRARHQLDAGADGVKLFNGEIVGGVVLMDPAVASAVVAAAHARGKRAFAHPADLRGLDIARDAGIDVLAHTTPADGPWPDALARDLAARKVALIPTLKLFEVELRKGGAPAAVAERFRAASSQQVSAMRAAGGTILFGTDGGYIADTDTTREFQLMAQAGMDWRAILASLTIAPAAFFGYEAHKGRIATGMDADLVLLGGDPANDVAAFADVRATLRGGRVLYIAPADAARVHAAGCPDDARPDAPCKDFND